VYHHQLFATLLRNWEQVRSKVFDLSGDESIDGLLGLDQMGHFGAQGCELVIDAIFEWRPRRGRLALGELGCGFGAPLRYAVHRLTGREVVIERAVGIDLVLDHCLLFGTINRSLGQHGTHPICASASRLPLRSECLDAVFAAGAASYFDDMPAVLAESRRVLRPGGLVAILEEVSLLNVGTEVSERFRELHPAGVVFPTSVPERLRQYESAGFADVRLTDLTEWARELLDDRLKAGRLLQGTMESVFGERESRVIIDTLKVARDEIAAGTLAPALVTAHAPPADEAAGGLA
jgi:SAM-dependent methyltransferase